MTEAERIAGRLTERGLAEELLDDERSPYASTLLNAAELVHIDVVRDSRGLLLDMKTKLTPLGQAVAEVLRRKG